MAERETHFFSLADINAGTRQDLAKGIVAHTFSGDHAMLSFVRIEPNCAGRVHSHAEEQWGFLIEGGGIRIQGGARVPVTRGDFWHTPPRVEHTFEAGPAGAFILDVFSPPRREYRMSTAGASSDPRYAAQDDNSNGGPEPVDRGR